MAFFSLLVEQHILEITPHRRTESIPIYSYNYIEFHSYNYRVDVSIIDSTTCLLKGINRDGGHFLIFQCFKCTTLRALPRVLVLHVGSLDYCTGVFLPDADQFSFTGIISYTHQECVKMLCLHSLADGVCCQTFGFFFLSGIPILCSQVLLSLERQRSFLPVSMAST